MLVSLQLLTLLFLILKLTQGTPVPTTTEDTSTSSSVAESSSAKSSEKGPLTESFSYFLLNGEPIKSVGVNKNVTLTNVKIGIPAATSTSTSESSTSTLTSSSSTDSTSNSTNIGLTGSEGYETLFLWEIYSRILDTQKSSLQSLLLKDDFNSLLQYAPFTTDLMKALILASHKDPSDTQKKLVSDLSDQAISDGNYIQSAIYNVSGGFETSWDPSIVYTGLSNYVEAWETFNAELPDLIRSTAQSARIPWIKQLYTVNSAINNKKFIDFFLKVENNVKDLNDFGIKYNATSKYILFSSSSQYTSLDSAVSAYNKKISSNALTTDLIREVQITYELASRMLDLWSNAASAT